MRQNTGGVTCQWLLNDVVSSIIVLVKVFSIL